MKAKDLRKLVEEIVGESILKEETLKLTQVIQEVSQSLREFQNTLKTLSSMTQSQGSYEGSMFPFCNEMIQETNVNLNGLRQWYNYFSKKGM